MECVFDEHEDEGKIRTLGGMDDGTLCIVSEMEM